jgi:hypothetical protein
LKEEKVEEKKVIVNDFENVVGQDSLTRFDSDKKKQVGKPNNHRGNFRPQLSKPDPNKSKSDAPKMEVSKPKNEHRRPKDNGPRFQKPIKKNTSDQNPNAANV